MKAAGSGVSMRREPLRREPLRRRLTGGRSRRGSRRLRRMRPGVMGLRVRGVRHLSYLSQEFFMAVRRSRCPGLQPKVLLSAGLGPEGHSDRLRWVSGALLPRGSAGRIGAVGGGGPPGAGRVEDLDRACRDHRAAYFWSAAGHADFPPGGVDGGVVVPAEQATVVHVGLSLELPRNDVVNLTPGSGDGAAWAWVELVETMMQPPSRAAIARRCPGVKNLFLSPRWSTSPFSPRMTSWKPPAHIFCRTARRDRGASTPSIQPTPCPVFKSVAFTCTITTGAAPPRVGVFVSRAVASNTARRMSARFSPPVRGSSNSSAPGISSPASMRACSSALGNAGVA